MRNYLPDKYKSLVLNPGILEGNGIRIYKLIYCSIRK